MRIPCPHFLRPSSLAEGIMARCTLQPSVRGGIFAGMKYPRSGGHGSRYLPKLLGSYEIEIQPSLKTLLRDRWDAIINVGAGEGYYAAGCAILAPAPRIFASEAATSEHGLIRELAALNGVAGRIEVGGTCAKDDLLALLEAHRRSLVIMDVEGAEAALLGDPVARIARNAAFVVELHEFVDPDLFGKIVGRFRESHAIRSIWTRPRTPWNVPYPALPLRLYMRHHLTKHMDEWRPGPMRWLIMTPLPR